MEVARANNGQWRPGQSGNPAGLPGRPLGSRQPFSQGFTRDLAEVWQAKGKQAMNWTADHQPAVFFATCARLLPNMFKLRSSSSYCKSRRSTNKNQSARIS
jgi:hypothetical protein